MVIDTRDDKNKGREDKHKRGYENGTDHKLTTRTDMALPGLVSNKRHNSGLISEKRDNKKKDREDKCDMNIDTKTEHITNSPQEPKWCFLA